MLFRSYMTACVRVCVRKERKSNTTQKKKASPPSSFCSSGKSPTFLSPCMYCTVLPCCALPYIVHTVQYAPHGCPRTKVALGPKRGRWGARLALKVEINTRGQPCHGMPCHVQHINPSIHPAIRSVSPQNAKYQSLISPATDWLSEHSIFCPNSCGGGGGGGCLVLKPQRGL